MHTSVSTPITPALSKSLSNQYDGKLLLDVSLLGHPTLAARVFRMAAGDFRICVYRVSSAGTHWHDRQSDLLLPRFTRVHDLTHYTSFNEDYSRVDALRIAAANLLDEAVRFLTASKAY